MRVLGPACFGPILCPCARTGPWATQGAERAHDSCDMTQIPSRYAPCARHVPHRDRIRFWGSVTIKKTKRQTATRFHLGPCGRMWPGSMPGGGAACRPEGENATKLDPIMRAPLRVPYRTLCTCLRGPPGAGPQKSQWATGIHQMSVFMVGATPRPCKAARAPLCRIVASVRKTLGRPRCGLPPKQHGTCPTPSPADCVGSMPGKIRCGPL